MIAFEPLLDKYAVVLARGTRRYHKSQIDMAVPLARHHKRGILLPLALSPTGGPVNLTVMERAGCSSIAGAAYAHVKLVRQGGSPLSWPLPGV